MIIGYQTNSALQAFPNHTSTENKVFLLIYEHHVKYNGRIFMSRDYMASVLGVTVTTISRITRKLHKAGLIIKTVTAYDYKKRRCNYSITEQGHYWRPYIVQAYNLLKKVFLSISLLFSPDASNVTLVSLKVKNGVDVLGVERELQTTHATLQAKITHDRLSVTDGNTQTKKKESMEVPEHIKLLTTKLHLTAHGQVKFMTLPQSSIEYALERAKTMTKSEHMFRDIFEVASLHAKDRGLPIDWPSYYKAVETGVVKKTDFYHTKKVSFKDVFPSSTKAASLVRGSNVYEAYRARKKAENETWMAQNKEKVLNFIRAGGGIDFISFIADKKEESLPAVQPVTKRHDLESSEIVSSGYPNRTILEPQTSPISKCIVKGGTIMCLGRQAVTGQPQKNMVEPEPIEYEQESLWEEVL